SNGSTTTGASIAASPGTPTRAGYTFNGWFAASTGGSAITFPYAHGQTANFTLFAQWTVIEISSATTTTTTVAATTTTVAATTTTVAATTTTVAATTTTIAPSLSAPKKATAGKKVSIVAEGFQPGERVLLRVGSGGSPVRIVADANGSVRLAVALESVSAGTQEVSAQSATTGRKVTQQMRITVPSTDLPVTGSPVAPLATISFTLLLIGFLLTWRQRLLPR
ncbi:MAG: hypothetical protein FGM42_04265, partial [Ilumatobacteraceae bacterium]|nr:hypothetical protein [Ilumatobacteraceae bacterium]